MTLDDVIDALQALRAQLPSAGSATVSIKYWPGIDWDIRYDGGEVWIFEDWMTEGDDPEPARDFAEEMVTYYQGIVQRRVEEERIEGLKRPLSKEEVRSMLSVVKSWQSDDGLF